MSVMRIKPNEVQFIADKIARDLANSGIVSLKKGLEVVSSAAFEIIAKDMQIEQALDAKVKELLSIRQDDEYAEVDERQLFWMIKRKIAEEYNFILDHEERINHLAHTLLDECWNEDLMDYDVAEIRVKNIIVKSIMDYSRRQNDIDKEVEKKLTNYKRKLVPGSEEFEIVKTKLIEEELKKRGML